MPFVYLFGCACFYVHTGNITRQQIKLRLTLALSHITIFLKGRGECQGHMKNRFLAPQTTGSRVLAHSSASMGMGTLLSSAIFLLQSVSNVLIYVAYLRKLAVLSTLALFTCIYMATNYIKTKKTEPDLVAFYDIQPGNGVGLFLQPWSPHI